jgi:hypothetical protein
MRGPDSPPAPACPDPAWRDCGVSAPACLWRTALSSASARPRAVGLGVAPLPLAARNAARARLGPGVCVARPRRVSAALRARAHMERAVLWHGSPCPLCVRLPLGVPVYPPSPVYFMCANHVVHINKWKLDLEIGYVSYIM